MFHVGAIRGPRTHLGVLAFFYSANKVSIPHWYAFEFLRSPLCPFTKVSETFEEVFESSKYLGCFRLLQGKNISGSFIDAPFRVAVFKVQFRVS